MLLSLCFLDSEEAFDSIYRKLMGKILRYGMSKCFVQVVSDLHDGTHCKVMVDESLSDAFKVKYRIIKGRILSPLLFVLFNNFEMKRVVRDYS